MKSKPSPICSHTPNKSLSHYSRMVIQLTVYDGLGKDVWKRFPRGSLVSPPLSNLQTIAHIDYTFTHILKPRDILKHTKRFFVTHIHTLPGSELLYPGKRTELQRKAFLTQETNLFSLVFLVTGSPRLPAAEILARKHRQKSLLSHSIISLRTYRSTCNLATSLR